MDRRRHAIWADLPLAVKAFQQIHFVAHDSASLHHEDVLEGANELLCIPPALSKPEHKKQGTSDHTANILASLALAVKLDDCLCTAGWLHCLPKV